MTLRLVDAQDLTLELPPLWQNPRSITGLGKEEISEFGEDMKKRGQLVPLLVQRVTLGKTDKNNQPVVYDLVLDGQRRVLGALDQLSATFKMQVVDYDDSKVIELDEASAATLLLDALATGQREGLSSWEQSETAEKLRKAGKSNEIIGKAIGRSASWVSRMLKARESASSKLLASWKGGDLTDDQFKDLAEVKEEKQPEKIKEIVELRESGDKSEAYVRQKEIREEARKEKPVKPAKPEKVAKPGKAAKPSSSSKPDKPEPPKPVKPSPAQLMDIVNTAAKVPPVHDYVKGVVAGVQYALGLHPGKWAAPWSKWIDRVTGAPKKAKKGKAKPSAKKKSKKR